MLVRCCRSWLPSPSSSASASAARRRCGVAAWLLGAVLVGLANQPSLRAGEGGGSAKKDWFDRLDKDGDGRISATEGKKRKKHLQKLDQDGDGVVTRAEYRRWRELRQARIREGRQAPAKPERPKPAHPRVQYGPHEAQWFMAWRAAVDGPAPVIVYFHPGGFTGGKPEWVPTELVAAALDRKIHVVSATYRKLQDGVELSEIFEDGQRVLRFLRQHREAYAIDPERIGAAGGSAGGGIAMWVAYGPDGADPKAPDPMLHHSTKAQAVALIGTTPSYDPVLFTERTGQNITAHEAYYPLMGLDPKTATPEQVRERALAYSGITHLTRDDPPTFILAGGRPEHFFEPRELPNLDKALHHPVQFGPLVQKARAMDLTLAWEPTYEAMVEFFADSFGMEAEGVDGRDGASGPPPEARPADDAEEAGDADLMDALDEAISP